MSWDLQHRHLSSRFRRLVAYCIPRYQPCAGDNRLIVRSLQHLHFLPSSPSNQLRPRTIDAWHMSAFLRSIPVAFWKHTVICNLALPRTGA